MGLTAHSISCGADKEVEVGALIGLLYMLYVEPLPAAYGIGEACEGGGVEVTALQLLLWHLQRQHSAGYVEVILSPVFTNPSGPPAAASGATCSTTVP